MSFPILTELESYLLVTILTRPVGIPDIDASPFDSSCRGSRLTIRRLLLSMERSLQFADHSPDCVLTARIIVGSVCYAKSLCHGVKVTHVSVVFFSRFVGR